MASPDAGPLFVSVVCPGKSHSTGFTGRVPALGRKKSVSLSSAPSGHLPRCGKDRPTQVNLLSTYLVRIFPSFQKEPSMRFAHQSLPQKQLSEKRRVPSCRLFSDRPPPCAKQQQHAIRPSAIVTCRAPRCLSSVCPSRSRVASQGRAALSGVPHKTQRPAARRARVLSRQGGGDPALDLVWLRVFLFLCFRRRLRIMPVIPMAPSHPPPEGCSSSARTSSCVPNTPTRALRHVEIPAVDVAGEMVRVKEATRSR